MAKLTITEIHDKMLDFLVGKLRSLYLEGVSQRAIAEKIGVKQPTVARLINGDRGAERFTLSMAIQIIKGLGVEMSEMANAIGEDNLAEALDFLVNNRDLATKMSAIIKAGGADRLKLETDINYMASKLPS